MLFMALKYKYFKIFKIFKHVESR